MVLVFDMDDTLYEEHTYAESGLGAVAGLLSPVLKIAETSLKKRLCEIQHRKGRGAVFNQLLIENDHYSKKLVQKCVTCYRTHRPSIRLSRPGRACLQRFASEPLYLVTDGNKTAQAAKVAALGLEKLVRKVFITHRYGVAQAKPSPYCFQLIQKREKVTSREIFYVGDNPKKDFVGIKPLGFRTIRVRTGPFAQFEVEPSFDAEVSISSLDEITPGFLNSML